MNIVKLSSKAAFLFPVNQHRSPLSSILNNMLIVDNTFAPQILLMTSYFNINQISLTINPFNYFFNH